MPLDADLIADAAAEAVAPIFRRQIETIKALESRLADFEARLAAAEAREPLRGEKGSPGERGEPGPAGKDADIEELAARLLPEVHKAVAQLPPAERGEKGEAGERGPEGVPGKDADPEAVKALLLPEIERMVSAIDVPKGERGEAGPQGEPGRDADPEVVKAMLMPEVERAVAALPTQKGEKGDAGEPGPEGAPGKDADPETVKALLLPEIERMIPAPLKGDKGDAGDRGEKGDPGADGVGVSGAMIDRSGSLVLTLRDGTVCPLGPVVGKDGEQGRDGRDGNDGLGFDDMLVEHDGHRGFAFVFERGAERKEFRFSLPVVLDCGVFKEGETYDAGDGVTWGGSYWIAKQVTAQKPGEGEEWRLSVKRGRDGKAPEMDVFVERSLPKLVERLAPVVRKAIKDAKDG